MLQSNPKLMEILAKTKGQPTKRFQHIYDLCKAKNMCEGGDIMDNQFEANLANGEEPEKKVQFVISFPRKLLILI